MERRHTLLSSLALSLVVGGCLAPTVPDAVCKSEVLMSILRIPHSFNRPIEDNMSNFRKFDDELSKMIAAMSTKDCRPSTLAAIERFKIAASKYHTSVLSYDAEQLTTEERDAIERSLSDHLATISATIDEIDNS